MAIPDEQISYPWDEDTEHPPVTDEMADLWDSMTADERQEVLQGIRYD